jgi:dTDP-4-dehydrorhamnose 3,5-epimerase
MKAHATPLPGVVVLAPDAFADARGHFLETFRRDRYAELGVGVGLEFVQDNLSWSRRGTLRGLHYARTRPQGKLVYVTRGEIFDVAVDVRAGSPTAGRWFGVTLSSDNHHQLWIPPGFAHGFLARSDADVAYKCTATHDPADEHTVRWDDPALAIAWPLDGPPLLSARDAAAPCLRDAPRPGFTP